MVNLPVAFLVTENLKLKQMRSLGAVIRLGADKIQKALDDIHQALFMFTERGRFELPLGVTLNLISSQTHSTTLPSLQYDFLASLINKAIAIISQSAYFGNLKNQVVSRMDDLLCIAHHPNQFSTKD